METVKLSHSTIEEITMYIQLNLILLVAGQQVSIVNQKLLMQAWVHRSH